MAAPPSSITAESEYHNLSQAEKNPTSKRRLIVLGLAVFGVVAALAVTIAVALPKGSAGSSTFSTHSRAASSGGKIEPSRFMTRHKIDINNWADIKKTYFNPILSHSNMPWPISDIFEHLFMSEGRVFFGAQDTEGTEPRLTAVNDAITRLGLPTNDLKAIGVQAAEALRKKDTDALRSLIASTIAPRFVPSFKVTKQFIEDYATLAKYILPGTSWLDPLRSWKMSSAKGRILPMIDHREDVFHHLMAAHGLIDMLERIPTDEIKKNLEDSQANGGSFNIMVLFSGSTAPAGQAPRTIKAASDLGLATTTLDKNDLVFLVGDRPDIQFREERFFACAGQRFVTQVAKHTVDAYYPGYRTHVIRPGTADEVLNPSSTAIFQQQGEL